MTKSKPADQECGNCYYCISYVGKEVIRKGIFGQDEKEVERYLCNRNPPLPILRGSSDWNGFSFDISSDLGSRVNKINWCGEWKRDHS